MMSNKMKKIFIFLLMGIVAISLVGCKDSYEYPDKTPMISNKDVTFIGVENWKVTNEEAYVRLLNSYGYSALLEWVDGIIYEGYSPVGFEDFLNNQIYGTTDLTELSRKEMKEKEDAWAEAMENNGYATEEQWRAHYQILFKRNQLTRSKIVENITEFEKVVNVLEGLDFPAYVTEDLDLLTADANVDEDLEVTWTSNSSYVTIKKNKAVVTRGKYDVEVTLTAVATIGDNSTSGTYVFTVPATSVTPTTEQLAEKAEKTVTGYFAESSYESYLTSNYRPNVKTAIVTFDSDAEAKALLDSYGVDILKLNGQKWVNKEGTVMTEEEVKSVFVSLYNDTRYLDGSQIDGFDEMVTEYTSDELAELNSTIATKVYNLKALNNLEEDEDYHDCYTVMPTLFGSKFFLAFNVEMGEEVELDSVRSEIKEKLIDAQVITSQINRYAMENIMSNGTLHIYSEGLENTFVNNYASVYSALSITDYDAYTRTKGTSDANVASYEYNGQTYNLTADDLFALLVKQYGASLAVSYLNQYVVLEHSDIINFTTHEILDQDAYDDIYESAVQTYKDNFKNNSYNGSGYSNEYGWNNFLRDYLGITDEFQLIVATGGTVYNNALDDYKKTLYTHDDVYKEAENIFNDYFSTAVYTVSTYVDQDDNGNSDNFELAGLDSEDMQSFNNFSVEDFWLRYSSKYEAYGITQEDLEDAKNVLEFNNSASYEFLLFLEDLVNLSFSKNQTQDAANMTNSYFTNSNPAVIVNGLITIANAIAEDNETIRTRFAELTTYYAIATPNDPIFGRYKNLGLQVVVTSSTTYTTSSSLEDHFKEQVKALYDEGINYQALYYSQVDEVNTGNEPTTTVNSYVYGTDITGESLDPYYTYTKKPDDVNSQTYTVRPFVSDTFFNNDRMTLIFVTTVNDRTKISKTVTDLLDDAGEIVYDADGAPVQYVKYTALEILTAENYADYLLDSDDDEDTESTLTTAQKSVITTYYVAAITNLTDSYADQMIDAQLQMINDNKVTINSTFTTLKDDIMTLLQNNYSEDYLN